MNDKPGDVESKSHKLVLAMHLQRSNFVFAVCNSVSHEGGEEGLSRNSGMFHLDTSGHFLAIFCYGCHTSKLDVNKDSLRPQTVPEAKRGIGCLFCLRVKNMLSLNSALVQHSRQGAAKYICFHKQ